VYFNRFQNIYIKNKILKLNKMIDKEQVLGLVRHALTFIGGILIAKGLASDGQIGEMIGAAVTLVGTVWSVLSKKA
jgi:hypothetical protein